MSGPRQRAFCHARYDNLVDCRPSFYCQKSQNKEKICIKKIPKNKIIIIIIVIIITIIIIIIIIIINLTVVLSVYAMWLHGFCFFNIEFVRKLYVQILFYSFFIS